MTPIEQAKAAHLEAIEQHGRDMRDHQHDPSFLCGIRDVLATQDAMIAVAVSDLQQQLASALQKLDDHAMPETYLVRANHAGRAQVIAQVKALLNAPSPHSAYRPMVAHVLAKLDALQPDPNGCQVDDDYASPERPA